MGMSGSLNLNFLSPDLLSFYINSSVSRHGFKFGVLYVVAWPLL